MKTLATSGSCTAKILYSSESKLRGSYIFMSLYFASDVISVNTNCTNLSKLFAGFARVKRSSVEIFSMTGQDMGSVTIIKLT